MSVFKIDQRVVAACNKISFNAETTTTATKKLMKN